jgi:hypothetical protein
LFNELENYMNTITSSHRLLFTSLSRQRGASLLEGIAYLGIAAIVVLGAVSLLTGAFSSAQSNRVAEEVVSIRTAVKKLYMGQSSGYGTTDLLGILIPTKVLPTTITADTATNTATNAWGGAVTVTGNAGNRFNIAYANVPGDACINILSGASGWDNISASGATPITVFPATPLAAQGACVTGANIITWTSL